MSQSSTAPQIGLGEAPFRCSQPGKRASGRPRTPGSRARIPPARVEVDSQGHLLTDEALIAHLRAVRQNLRRGGVYVFDRMVPNGWARPGGRWTWTKRRRGITVRTTFRTLLDYDVARQVCDEVMRFEITEGGRRRVVTQRHRTRIVYPQELRALVAAAGGFEFCGWFSNFRLDRPLERAAAALVMITGLRAV